MLHSLAYVYMCRADFVILQFACFEVVGLMLGRASGQFSHACCNIVLCVLGGPLLCCVLCRWSEQDERCKFHHCGRLLVSAANIFLCSKRDCHWSEILAAVISCWHQRYVALSGPWAVYNQLIGFCLMATKLVMGKLENRFHQFARPSWLD